MQRDPPCNLWHENLKLRRNAVNHDRPHVSERFGQKKSSQMFPIYFVRTDTVSSHMQIPSQVLLLRSLAQVGPTSPKGGALGLTGQVSQWQSMTTCRFECQKICKGSWIFPLQMVGFFTPCLIANVSLHFWTLCLFSMRRFATPEVSQKNDTLAHHL